MKPLFTALVLGITAGAANAQALHEDFNSGIPSNWAQFSTTGVNWTINDTLGSGETGAAHSKTPFTGTGWLRSPSVDLSSLDNPELTFKVALIGSDFGAPNIRLQYNNGEGWMELSSWGSVAAGASEDITQTFDFDLPLNIANVTFVNITYSLEAISNSTDVKFAFGSEFVFGGGWVVLDDVTIDAGAPPALYTLPYTQDFEDHTFPPTDWEFYATFPWASWQHSPTIGAYGNSSSSAFFDNFSFPLNGESFGMRTVYLDFSEANTPMLKFDVAYARQNATFSDILNIRYSENDGPWNTLATYDGDQLTTTIDHTTYFEPGSNEWDSITIDLSEFAGTAQLRLAFENYSQGGNVLYIDNVRIYDLMPTSVEPTPEQEASVRISPNPSTGRVRIDIGALEFENLVVCNILGQNEEDYDLSPVNANMFDLDLQHLEAGPYFIIVKTRDQKTHINKLILN